MNMHVPPAITSKVKMLDLVKMSYDKQIALFERIVADTAQNLLRLAEIWAFWTKEGTIPEQLKKTHWAKALPLIHGRRIAPEVFLNYREIPPLYNAIVTLPIEDQKLLVDKGTLPVKREGGEVKEVPLADLAPSDIRRAIKYGRILSPEEQDVPVRNISSVPERIPVSFYLEVNQHRALQKHADLSARSIPALIMQLLINNNLLTE